MYRIEMFLRDTREWGIVSTHNTRKDAEDYIKDYGNIYTFRIVEVSDKPRQ